MNRTSLGWLLLALLIVSLVAGCVPSHNPSPRRRQQTNLNPVRKFPGLARAGLRTDPFALDNRAAELPQLEPTPTKASAPLPGLFLSEAEQENYRSFWPKTDQPFLAELKGKVSFYDKQVVPAVYQVWDQGRGRSGLRTVAAGNGGKNANREFPWNATAGLASASSAKVIHGVYLPGPIAWWHQLPKGVYDGIAWEYPAGTSFVELLLETVAGYDYCFELRVRTKRDDGTWEIDLYRPFASEERFTSRLSDLGFAYQPGPGSYGALVSRNRRESDGRVVTGLFSEPTRLVADVPDLGDALAVKLLDEPFTSVRRPWRKDEANGLDAFAPAHSGSGPSLVPPGYSGGFLKVSTASCMRCHEDVGTVVVEPGDARWRIRGSDGIFTFHPFDAEGIGQGQMRLSRILTAQGLLRHKEGMP